MYGAIRWVESAPSPTLEVELHPRANGRSVCSGCLQSGLEYDRLPARHFEFVPFWGMKVFLVYAPRRVACTRCGVWVEEMPWAEGKHPVTRTYAWFLASWAKRLSWKEVAEVFQSSWDVVFGAVEMAVAYGREHLDLSGIQSLGIDEIAWGRGHRYLTVVYQIDAYCKRLLWVGEKRTVKTLLTFFHWLGAERSAALRFICSDIWKPYLKVIRSVRSCLLKEDFQFFWGYRSPYWAGCFLDRWCMRTMRSKIGPMKRVARMLRGHRPLILNWFRAKGQLSSGVVEGFNAKAKLTVRKAYGFRTYHGLEVALYHTLSALPKPKFTHRSS